MKNRTKLKIDDKTAIKYNDGTIVESERCDLRLLVDNEGAHDIAKSFGPSKRTKYLDVRHLYIQEQVNQKKLKLIQIRTINQETEFLSKSVTRILSKSNDKYWPIYPILGIRIPNIVIYERRNINREGCYGQLNFQERLILFFRATVILQ